MPKVSLVLLIHAHQPIGNFDEVIEHTYGRSYLPFVDCLEQHPQVRVGLHYSGSLLEWLAARHPEYLDRIAGLAARGDVFAFFKHEETAQGALNAMKVLETIQSQAARSAG